MGYLQASEMARLADLDKALRWHLTSNHYPPIPLSMVDVCKTTIELVSQECFGHWVKLPEGVKYKNKCYAPVTEVVDFCHLEAFLE